MAKIDLHKMPRFSELPVRNGAPPESNWGVFGDDELGCLNFLTEEGVVSAARLVRRGHVFRLATPINYARPPLFNRTRLNARSLLQSRYCDRGPQLSRACYTAPL
jgi:hypothetical protein